MKSAKSIQNLTENRSETVFNPTQPTVYFRGLNRVHVNRFKARTYIISNRLNAEWAVTDDIKSANIVIDLVQTENSKSLQMSVLSGPANLKPPVLAVFELVLDDKKLIQQLNQASRQLKQSNRNHNSSAGSYKVINVCGLLNESLSLFCDLLNKKSQATRFIPSIGVISSQSQLYRDQLLLIIDGKDKDSIQAYKSLIKKKLNANIIIDELTIAIIKSKDEALNEKVFDMVYEHSDNHTDITLINMEDESDLDVFVSYF